MPLAKISEDKRFNPCATHGQFYAQRAFADGPLLNDEILPHTVHAHAVFLGEPGPSETRGLAVKGYGAGGWEAAMSCSSRSKEALKFVYSFGFKLSS